MSEEGTPEPALPTEQPIDSSGLEREDHLSVELTTIEMENEPWARYGIYRASPIDLKHQEIDRQAAHLAERLNQQAVVIAIGRDCGAPVRDIAIAAAFKRAASLPNAALDVFVLRLDEEAFDEDFQGPQKLADFEDILRVLPSSALLTGGVERSILCVELSFEEPPGLARSLLTGDSAAERFGSSLQGGQQIIFVLDLKAQEKLPSTIHGGREEVCALDWVQPLLSYYNENWDLEPATISKAVSDLRSEFADRPEREAALYGIIYTLKNSFRGGNAEFEHCVREAVTQSRQTGEVIVQLGSYFSSGNRIEQIILALAAFGPTMSHRTFAALGARFLPKENIPARFLPETARAGPEDGTPERVSLSWIDAWNDYLDYYRNRSKVTLSRNQEVELRVNRDSLREHLLEHYPASLQRIIEAIPHLLRAQKLDREIEEGAIRLLIRLAVTDVKSYDRGWFVKCLLDLSDNASSNHRQTTIFKLSTALRVLDEQTSLERPGFAEGVFVELIKVLRKQGFTAGAIVELCKRLNAERFRTQATLEGLLHNSSFEEFRGMLDNLGFARGRLTSSQRLSLMSSFTKYLITAPEYREKSDHKAKRALWLWDAGLRADRFPTHVHYRRIVLHRTLARELFLATRETAESLLRGIFRFDPRALIFVGQNRRDLRRWLENISAVTIRALDADTNGLVTANEDRLAQLVSDCVLKPLYGDSVRIATNLNAFDELESFELWRDVYNNLDTNTSDQATADFAERLLLLPMVARSALIAEWFFQLEFCTHSIPKTSATQNRDEALGLLLKMRDTEPNAAHIADHFDYLAGILGRLAALSETHCENAQLAEMYRLKCTTLEHLAMSIKH